MATEPMPEAVVYPEGEALQPGCYLMRYARCWGKGAQHCDGTLRVQRQDKDHIMASGDLYRRPSQPPDPAKGIPIFPIALYRFYLCVTHISTTRENGLKLTYNLHRFDESSYTCLEDGVFTADLDKKVAPDGARYPRPKDYWVGEVKKGSSEEVVGKLEIGWVSEDLRRAVLEIDTVDQVMPPYNNKSDKDYRDWHTVFKEAGWGIKVIYSDRYIPKPKSGSWTFEELHHTMTKRRDLADLDSEWRYHLLCVNRLEVGYLGYMFDMEETDKNNTPREGAVIAFSQNFQRQPLGTLTGLYFHTAVHEVGHLMGLSHKDTDNDFMRNFGNIMGDDISEKASPIWSFSCADKKSLGHRADMWVRPGGVPFLYTADRVWYRYGNEVPKS